MIKSVVSKAHSRSSEKTRKKAVLKEIRPGEAVVVIHTKHKETVGFGD